MAGDPQYQGLKDALEALEKAALTPVISGEAEAWLQNIVRETACVQAEFTERVQPVHVKLFTAIAEADAELLVQVEQLEAEDDAIAKDLARLGPRASDVAKQISEEQWNETMIADSLQKLSESAVALVTRIRKQETTLATWLGESLNRDRGTAD